MLSTSQIVSATLATLLAGGVWPITARAYLGSFEEQDGYRLPGAGQMASLNFAGDAQFYLSNNAANGFTGVVPLGAFPNTLGDLTHGADLSRYNAGVYGTIDGGTAWFKLGTGMPDVPVYDMAFEETTQTLVVGTHARSLFTLSLEEILTPMNTAVNQGAGKVGFWKLLANPAGSQLVLSGPTTRNGHPLNLTLLDLQGKAVLVRTISDQDVTDNVLTLDLPFLTTGVYYLQLTDGNQQQVIPVVIDQS